MKTIGVIGAGAWGTALAQAFASADRETLIWARESEVVTAINNQNENTIFLPSVPLSANLKATESLDEISAKTSFSSSRLHNICAPRWKASKTKSQQTPSSSSVPKA
jgi:glycerol-3-phosphate dehydrogenase